MKRRAAAMGVSPSAKRPQAALPPPFQPFSIPLDILEEIFLSLPPQQVVCVCRLVCRQWKDVADSECFWRERCRREGCGLADVSQTPRDWRLFYFLCKKRRNLLKNPRGDDDLNGWLIEENGGHHWKIEGLMAPHPNHAVRANFVTSFGMCRKSQTINLAKEGYSPAFMDAVQPHIRISDWYAPRWDCGCEYKLLVRLLDHRKEVLEEFAPDVVYVQQWNDSQWKQLSHVFSDYGRGVRYVYFAHGGKDSQYWAGWYGVRVTDSCVEVCPAC